MASSGFFLSGECARRFFFCLRCLSQTIFTTCAFNVLKLYPTPTTIFILPFLLLLAFCFHRTTACSTFRTGTAATTHGCRDCHGCNRDDDRRNIARNCSFGSDSKSSPPSRVETLVSTGTQDLISRRHEWHKTIMELQSLTRESWNRTWATDGAIAYW